MRRETHWPTFAFYFFFLLIYSSYKTRTRRGEWHGCIAAPPHLYLLSVIRYDWRISLACTLISSKVISILPDDQLLSVL